MSTRFTTEETKKLLGFVGYGNWAAQVWFIGMEEGLPKGADIVKALHTRLKFKPLDDCYRAHQQLHEADPMPNYLKHHTPPYRWQPTWWKMCELMLCLNGNDEPTLEQKHDYQAKCLGRSGGDTLLTEMLPLPATNVAQWRERGYDHLFAQPEKFVNRKVYREMVIPERIKLLRARLIKHAPPMVICYGDTYHADFKKLFHEVTKWQVQSIFTFSCWLDHTYVFLTPHFTSRKMNHQVKPLCQLIRSATNA